MITLLLSLVACTSARDAVPVVSVQARLFNTALERADGRAIVVTDLELAEAFIQDALAQEPSDYRPPPAIRKQADSRTAYGSTQVYSFRTEPSKTTTLVFLSGGAYIYQPTSMHLKFAAEMAERLDAELLMPAHAVAPHANAEQANAELVKMYQDMVIQRPEQRIILMGDSSGGGMALSMAQQIQAAGVRPADFVVMISPWLDIGMANPEITPERDAEDFMLDAKALAYVGQVWAGDLALDDPLKCEDFPDPDTLETMRSRAAMIVRLVEREGLSLRELLARFANPTLLLSLTLTQTLHQLTARSQFMAGAVCVLRVSCGWVHRAF